MPCELEHDSDDDQKQMELLVVVAIVTEVQAVKAVNGGGEQQLICINGQLAMKYVLMNYDQ